MVEVSSLGVSVDPGSELLHLILRGRWDTTALEQAHALAARNGVMWDDFLRTARTGGISPLVYETVRGQGLLPASIEAAVRLDYYGVAKTNVRRFHRLDEVLRRLAALAQAVYSNLALRPMGDFDLLVHEADVDGALDVLAKLGYACPHGEFRPGFIRAFNNQVMMRKIGDEEARPVEIHWRLISPLYYQRAIPTEWLWQTAWLEALGDAPVRILSPEAQIVHLCGHLLQHGGCERASPRQLYDLAEVIALYGERIDWEQVLERTQVYDLVLPVQGALERVWEAWRAPIPTEVLDRLHGLRPSPTEERVHGLFSTKSRVAQRLQVGLMSLPSWRLRVLYVWGTLFPSADYMVGQYRIPNRLLLPFYYPYRWLRGLRRVGG
jgi:hypothetical protein